MKWRFRALLFLGTFGGMKADVLYQQPSAPETSTTLLVGAAALAILMLRKRVKRNAAE